MLYSFCSIDHRQAKYAYAHCFLSASLVHGSLPIIIVQFNRGSLSTVLRKRRRIRMANATPSPNKSTNSISQHAGIAEGCVKHTRVIPGIVVHFNTNVSPFSLGVVRTHMRIGFVHLASQGALPCRGEKISKGERSHSRLGSTVATRGPHVGH